MMAVMMSQQLLVRGIAEHEEVAILRGRSATTSGPRSGLMVRVVGGRGSA